MAALVSALIGTAITVAVLILVALAVLWISGADDARWWRDQ